MLIPQRDYSPHEAVAVSLLAGLKNVDSMLCLDCQPFTTDPWWLAICRANHCEPTVLCRDDFSAELRQKNLNVREGEVKDAAHIFRQLTFGVVVWQQPDPFVARESLFPIVGKLFIQHVFEDDGMTPLGDGWEHAVVHNERDERASTTAWHYSPGAKP